MNLQVVKYLFFVILLSCNSWHKDTNNSYYYNYNEQKEEIKRINKREKMGIYAYCEPIQNCLISCYDNKKLKYSHIGNGKFSQTRTVYTQNILECEEKCKNEIFCNEKKL